MADLRSWIVDFPRLKRLEPGRYATLKDGRRYLIRRDLHKRGWWLVYAEYRGEFQLVPNGRQPSLRLSRRVIANQGGSNVRS